MNKKQVFDKINAEIKKRKRDDRAFIVGITGIDASGKTRFAEALNQILFSKKYRTQLINLDDFHNPKKIRYSDENQAENYYNKSFNIKAIIEKMLFPIHQKIGFSIKLTLLNLHTDNYEIDKIFSFSKDTIVILEGVFLFRKELTSYIDYKIFLEITFKESIKRAIKRDMPLYGKEVLKKYNEKYFPAQRKYLKDYPPLKTANIIIDNNNWESPKFVKHL